MVQLALPLEWQRSAPRPPIVAVAAPALPRARPAPTTCKHRRLGSPTVLREGVDPVYGSFVFEEVPCAACGVTVRRTRYPDLARRPDTLPEGDRTVIGSPSRTLRPC